jgi:hypothetical protein
MRLIGSVAVVALWAAAPLAAQSTGVPPTQTPTPTPTPSPVPTTNAVGPPQLRDFNLNGATTQPVQPPAAVPTPTPAPTTREAVPPLTEPRATPAPSAARRMAARPGPTSPAPDRDPSPDAVTVDLPPPSAAPVLPEVGFAPAPAPAPSAEAPIAADQPATNWWPWLAALLAVGLGAAFLWSRRQREGRERYAVDHDELGALVTPAADAPMPLPRAAEPSPAPRASVPTPATIPAHPRPRQPATPAPFPSLLPTPTPNPAPAPSPAPPSPPISGGIVASGLKPKIEFEVVPIRAETDGAEGAALDVDIIIMNRGSAPARDVLVDALLLNAGPQVDAEVGRFFLQPPTKGERVPLIAPMSSVTIPARLEVDSAKLAPLVVEGRKLLVPLIAVNASYRWSGGEMNDASSFLIGRGDAEGGKMAPFRIDRGARSWTGLAARLHSSGLER